MPSACGANRRTAKWAASGSPTMTPRNGPTVVRDVAVLGHRRPAGTRRRRTACPGRAGRARSCAATRVVIRAPAGWPASPRRGRRGRRRAASSWPVVVVVGGVSSVGLLAHVGDVAAGVGERALLDTVVDVGHAGVGHLVAGEVGVVDQLGVDPQHAAGAALVDGHLVAVEARRSRSTCRTTGWWRPRRRPAPPPAATNSSTRHVTRRASGRRRGGRGDRVRPPVGSTVSSSSTLDAVDLGRVGRRRQARATTARSPA